MANKTSQAQSGSRKRDAPRSAGVNLDFEDLLVSAITSVIIKRPENDNLPPGVDHKSSVAAKICFAFDQSHKAMTTTVAQSIVRSQGPSIHGSRMSQFATTLSTRC